MIIYLATTADEIQGLTLTEAGCKNRLISYHSLMLDTRKMSLETYTQNGFVESEKTRIRKEKK